MKIYCTGCGREVPARLAYGDEIYPNRPKFAALPFWVCDACGAFVGCHHKTATPTRPLGVLATPEIRMWRMRIHAALDPMWKEGKILRPALYRRVAAALGYRDFHVSEVSSEDEAAHVLRAVSAIRDEVYPGPWNR